MMHLSRRAALLGLGGAFVLGSASLALADAPGERRFVVVLLRGALDGMAAVVPYGDPGLTALRGEIVPQGPGEPDGMLDLGGFYGLHPALAEMHRMYQCGDLLIAHAVAGPWRMRSHFEAQDCLESGAGRRMDSGWLNRVVAAVPRGAVPRDRVPGEGALAIGVSVPLLLRGPVAVGNWAPHGFATPAADLYAAIAALHAADPVTGAAIREGLRERGFSDSVMGAEAPRGAGRTAFPALCTAAGEMLAASNGPRLAALEIGGWDTHGAQVARLAGPLRQLDAGLAALQVALGAAWRRTVVLVMTEFGRTARVNGTKGTDHGTAGVAFVAGGAMAGGRVLADWPGLGPGRLLDDRDLAPTADIRAVAMGLLADHLGLDDAALRRVFPGSQNVQPAAGLVRRG
jgi:uncharacterized protein (DUF1501 family)